MKSSAFKTEITGYDSDYFPSHIADLIDGNDIDDRFHDYFRVASMDSRAGVSVLTVVGNNSEVFKVKIEQGGEDSPNNTELPDTETLLPAGAETEGIFEGRIEA